MRIVCESEGIELVLVKSPMQSDAYYWYDEWDVQVREYADRHGIDYYNLINNEEIGIVGSDYADGVHLNFRGAEKTSLYFGKILKENYFSVGRAPAHDERTCEIWQEKLTKYYNERNEVEK